MTTTAQIEAFLACKRIGFAGVSTNPSDFSRTMLREFTMRGYDIVPIHPTAQMIEARPAFASVCDAGKLDAVFIMTPPHATEAVVVDCHRAGVPRVWMHRGAGAGTGSVEWHAVQYAKAFGIDVIEGECPLMFFPDTDRVHRAHACFRRAAGRYPEVVVTPPAPHRRWRAIRYGAFAWALATWAMLTLAGLFAWKTGLGARVVALPLAFGVMSWFYIAPGRLPPFTMAAWFTVTSLVLDVVILFGVVQRSAAPFGSLALTWLPYALAFTTAIVVGTRRTRPFARPFTPAHV